MIQILRRKNKEKHGEPFDQNGSPGFLKTDAK